MFKETKHKVKDFIDRLNGKIIFIWGNHDENNGIRTPILGLDLYYAGKSFYLVHRPEDAGYFGGELVLCGHVHGNWKFQRIDFFETSYVACNVGIDCWKYHPITIQEILNKYAFWKKENGTKL